MKSNKHELSPIMKKKNETVVPLMNKDRQMEHNIQSKVKHQWGWYKCFKGYNKSVGRYGVFKNYVWDSYLTSWGVKTELTYNIKYQHKLPNIKDFIVKIKSEKQ